MVESDYPDQNFNPGSTHYVSVNLRNKGDQDVLKDS